MSKLSRRRVVAVVSLLLVVPCAAALGQSAPAPAPASSARLGVLVVFDQMRGDYPIRWEGLFSKEGFGRLLHEGAWYRNCHYPFALTVTGAGHASLATGASPRTHGVVGNDWYEPATGDMAYCATGARYQSVPPNPAGSARAGEDGPGSGCPGRLLAPTLSDALKLATDGKARVLSLSFKDRGAVLTGGQHPDGCYWFETATGRFVSSTYYCERLPAAVDKFNSGRPADAWFDKPWQRLRPDLDYAKYSGPDDAPGEAAGVAQGVTFPHPLNGGLKTPGPRYYNALSLSPFGNDLLVDLACALIDDEKLGQHATPDLLCISFSCNDYVGHCWGPDSQEVLDVTLRSDVILQRLLDHLDRKVGKGRYIVALSADHGICPLPEVSRLHGVDARRVPPGELAVPAEKFLREKFHASDDTLCLERLRGGSVMLNDSFYLNRTWLREAKLEASQVETALAGFLRQQPAVDSAWTATELSAPTPPASEVGKRVWHSYYPGRSGDVQVVLKPNYLFANALNRGTTHGTPHPYDTHVPLVVYGTGVRAGIHADAITPLAAAAILARGLGIAPPAKCEATVPEGVFAR